MSTMSIRILVFIAAFIVLVVLPWWVSMVVLLGLTIYFPFYLEVLFFGFLFRREFIWVIVLDPSCDWCRTITPNLILRNPVVNFNSALNLYLQCSRSKKRVKIYLFSFIE